MNEGGEMDGFDGYEEWMEKQKAHEAWLKASGQIGASAGRAYQGQHIVGRALGNPNFIPRIDPGMSQANLARDLPPVGVEMRCLNEALQMQTKLLSDLAARLAPISMPTPPTTAQGDGPQPGRSSVTEALHAFRCRVEENTETIRSLIAGLEI